MARNDPGFSSRLGPLLVAFARARGLDFKALTAKHKLPEDLELDKPRPIELTTPLSTMRALAEDIAAQLADEHLGLSLAAWLPRGAYGVVEFLIHSTPTMRGVFENVVRFSACLAPNQTFTFHEGDEAEQHNHPTHQPAALGRHLNEYTTALLVQHYRAMSQLAEVKRVWFTSSAPRSLDTLRSHFGTSQLAFDQASNGFSIDKALLDRPARNGDPALYSFLEEHALQALASRPKTDDLIDKLRHLIRDALKQGEPNIERVATRLHMSGRTLQRRLANLKTSFQEVLDGVRFDLARNYLRDERLDISQVAYLLGYSELRAFDRAFRRWAGMAPREWRAQKSS